MPNIPTANNNPGNIRGPDGNFMTFKTPLEGQTALYNDLTLKMTGQSKTGLNGQSSLYQFAQKYAPKSDGNDPANYAANLANELGVSPDTQIGTLIPRIDDFAKAVAKHEGYKGTWAGGSQTTAPAQGKLGSTQTQTTPAANGFLPITPVSAASPGMNGDLSVAQPSSSFGQKVLNTGNTIADVMGIQKFGQGIATAAREFTGGGNEEKDAQAAAAKAFTDMVGKYAPGSPERKAAFAKYRQIYEQGGIPTEAEIDPGTTISNKELARSTANTIGWALSGGSMPTEGMQSFNIAQKGVNGVTKITAPLAYKAAAPIVKTATTGGGVMGNLMRALLLNKVISAGSGGKIDLMKDAIGLLKGLE